METTGPPTLRVGSGPLSSLLWRREAARPPFRARISAYVVPLGLLALVGLGFAAGEYLEDNRDLVPALAVVLAAGSVLPVVLTYRLPVLAWRVGYPMLFLGVINADPREPWPWNTVQILGALLVLGRLAVTQSTGVTAWATALSLIPIFLYAPSGNDWGAAVLLVAIAALGDILYRRNNVHRLLAEKEELTELERARRAVLEERTRIAREMHDVVAHHMSMIAVRAETAPYRLPALPPEARQEMAGIADAAREALTDMRRLLGVLRAEEPDSPRAPQPGLADLDRLAETARESGVDLFLQVTDAGRVPETLGLAAYRIVQEALANAARHAPGRPVFVDVNGFPDRLELAVRNPLGGDPPGEKRGLAGDLLAARGHGLVGMRERATLLGGSLEAGPVEGDFVVRAVLPLTQETS